MQMNPSRPDSRCVRTALCWCFRAVMRRRSSCTFGAISTDDLRVVLRGDALGRDRDRSERDDDLAHGGSTRYTRASR